MFFFAQIKCRIFYCTVYSYIFEMFVIERHILMCDKIRILKGKPHNKFYIVHIFIYIYVYCSVRRTFINTNMASRVT